MSYWLVKTEPSTYSIDDLKRDKCTPWTAVRNYQARNFLQAMQVGDEVLVYHSNAEPPGVVGLASVAAAAKPDPTQFEKKSEYFDPKASPDKPRWFCPDLKFVEKFPELIPLDKLRTIAALKGMVLLQKGSRLSVQPVTAAEFRAIVRLGGAS